METNRKTPRSFNISSSSSFSSSSGNGSSSSNGSSTSAMTSMLGSSEQPCSAAIPLSSAAPCACSQSSSSSSSLPPSSPRRRQRLVTRRPTRPTRTRRSSAIFRMTIGGLALIQPSPICALKPSSPDEETSNRRDARSPLRPRRLDVGDDSSQTLSSRNNASGSCQPTQHTFLFTLYTDLHSIEDNSWEVSHASYGDGRETGNSGTYVDGQRLGSGTLGYGAVITHTFCADMATNVEMTKTGSGPATSIGASSLVESCYDLELRDANGDGLTAPHSASGAGGLAGGFSLQVDGAVVAEHRGKACLMSDGVDEKEWNDCAVESGFELCGLRICTLNDGAGGATTKATVSSLSGSQCEITQPQCHPTSLIKSSSSSISVNADTDSFGQELSYEVRKSSRSDPIEMSDALQNDLLLAGGRPVFVGGDPIHGDVILGQQGVGVDLADNESFESVACLTDKHVDDDSSCFDFRAYDAYGDGMGCGADGNLSLSLSTEEGVMTLTQVDKDMASRQQVDGINRLACMDRAKLSKWSYCAVRLCVDGTVIGLEGNQCDFGFGDALIDERYSGVDPLDGLEMKPPQPEPQLSLKEEVVNINTEDVVLEIIAEEDYDDEDELEDDEDDIEYDTWAEYYEALEPGFKEDGPFGMSTAIGDKDDISGTSVEGTFKFNFGALRPNQEEDEPDSSDETFKFNFGALKPNRVDDKPANRSSKGKQQQIQKGPRPGKKKRPKKNGKKKKKGQKKTKFELWKNDNKEQLEKIDISVVMNNSKKKKQDHKKQKRQDKLEKKQLKLAKLESKQQPRQSDDESKLNVMGYVSGSQTVQRLDSDGVTVVVIEDNDKGGRGGKNKNRQKQRRRFSNEGGGRRMLRQGSPDRNV